VASGSPESRNIPEEFDSLLAFLGRGRTTGGRRGKRNGGGRKSSEKRKRTGSGRNRKDERKMEKERRDGARERTKKRDW